jgi:uncharacterized protein (DUF58 family)
MTRWGWAGWAFVLGWIATTYLNGWLATVVFVVVVVAAVAAVYAHIITMLVRREIARQLTEDPCEKHDS